MIAILGEIGHAGGEGVEATDEDAISLLKLLVPAKVICMQQVFCFFSTFASYGFCGAVNGALVNNSLGDNAVMQIDPPQRERFAQS